MTTRVILVSPASSEALRQARFDADSPLDAAGIRRARSAADALPAATRTAVSPGVRCRQTADALGLSAVPDAALAGCAMGRWHGRTLDEVSAAEPAEVAAWLADPACAPHGGESLLTLCGRAGDWLAAAARQEGRVIAVAEPDVVRAAVVRALGLPEQLFWRIDVPPLTAVELSGRAGRWNLRAGRPLGGAG
ncbi:MULTISPECIES: histidine phosphatase family protein [unclassified Streptomyces]|uniref:histidine phosphatase family protein n=1 Tax=unclassified Streptomyces TaxID=2593676 RepID=UPI0038093791